MNKKEILAILNNMLGDYELSLKARKRIILYNLYTDTGFCKWLNFNYPVDGYDVLEELKVHKESARLNGYWYKIFNIDTMRLRTVQNLQIQPRYDHLKRTISRLETEILQAS